MTTIVIKGLCGGIETQKVREAKSMCGNRYLFRRGDDVHVEFFQRSDADLAVLSLNTITGVKASIEDPATQE